ncbi:hypothetical protein GOV05_05685 [Candidatus Woesearchaeota archaeon]|nr:hypothetical protein [Candidatus Woesearchaeota archaeon]
MDGVRTGLEVVVEELIERFRSEDDSVYQAFTDGVISEDDLNYFARYIAVIKMMYEKAINKAIKDHSGDYLIVHVINEVFSEVYSQNIDDVQSRMESIREAIRPYETSQETKKTIN